MLSHHLQVAINAAQAAGQVLEQHFRQIDALDFSDKGSGDIVSAADFEAESVIMRLLQERFPDVHRVQRRNQGDCGTRCFCMGY